MMNGIYVNASENKNHESVISTTIDWESKKDISPEELDKGLKELVNVFFEDGKYRPVSRQPELAFYDQKVVYAFEGFGRKLRQVNDIDQARPVELTAKLSTSSVNTSVDEKKYELSITLEGGFKLYEGLSKLLEKGLVEFAGKYTTFKGHCLLTTVR
jgi:hypothetical protein